MLFVLSVKTDVVGLSLNALYRCNVFECFLVFLEDALIYLHVEVERRRNKDMSPCCILFADEIVLCGTRTEGIEKKPEEPRRKASG